MSFNKVKAIKRISRKQFDEYGKSGAHQDTRKQKERCRPHTNDYMREYEDEIKEAKRLEDTEDDAYEQEIWGDWGDPEDDGDSPVGQR
jgi:hypothetical protein